MNADYLLACCYPDQNPMVGQMIQLGYTRRCWCWAPVTFGLPGRYGGEGAWSRASVVEGVCGYGVLEQEQFSAFGGCMTSCSRL